jgi:hypothetical protein
MAPANRRSPRSLGNLSDRFRAHQNSLERQFQIRPLKLIPAGQELGRFYG